MPDLAALSDAQRGALRDYDLTLDMYRQAVEKRMKAEAEEHDLRRRLGDLTYKIAGVN